MPLESLHIQFIFSLSLSPSLSLSLALSLSLSLSLSRIFTARSAVPTYVITQNNPQNSFVTLYYFVHLVSVGFVTSSHTFGRGRNCISFIIMSCQLAGAAFLSTRHKHFTSFVKINTPRQCHAYCVLNSLGADHPSSDVLHMVQIEALDAEVMTAWLQTFILRERNT